jgi:hypothetical protein
MTRESRVRLDSVLGHRLSKNSNQRRLLCTGPTLRNLNDSEGLNFQEITVSQPMGWAEKTLSLRKDTWAKGCRTCGAAQQSAGNSTFCTHAPERAWKGYQLYTINCYLFQLMVLLRIDWWPEFDLSRRSSLHSCLHKRTETPSFSKEGTLGITLDIMTDFPTAEFVTFTLGVYSLFDRSNMQLS